MLVIILLYLSSLAVYMVQMWLSMPCSGQMPTEGRPGSTCAMERECSHIVAAWEKGGKSGYNPVRWSELLTTPNTSTKSCKQINKTSLPKQAPK